MNEFQQAIVRHPSKALVYGITQAGLGGPEYTKALQQHELYCAALEQCGLAVKILDAADEYPDSVFVEDAAVLVANGAILTRPSAPTRRGEVDLIRPVLEQLSPDIHTISAPGTLDGGDVLRVGSDFYIGLSERTNEEGAWQLKIILERYGLSATIVPVASVLHLKTGVTALDDKRLLALEEFVGLDVFSRYEVIRVDSDEAPAANCLRINDTVLLPAGCPKTSGQVRTLGYNVVEVDISEYAKLDGGLTCLSLRY